MQAKSRRIVAAGIALAWAVAAPAWAGVTGAPPDYHWQWATIGAPGNRTTLPSETPWRPERPVGAVAYAYRMATTEVTIDQWFDFVRAYAPHVGADRTSFNFIGVQGINYWGLSNGVPQYSLDPAAVNFPVEIGWRYAARYCNWLVNNKATNWEAFQSGAYDTSTFTSNPDGTVNDQAVHTTGATYWIPSVDEWVKAAYYDPNRYGAGQEGYWLYPNASEIPLVGGFPGEPGAQTGAPLTGPGNPIYSGSYPGVNLPWGLLDISGGASEWTEGWRNAGSMGRSREVRGSWVGMGEFSYIYDRIENFSTNGASSGTQGFRLASLIPEPSSGIAFAMFLSVGIGRRRPCVGARTSLSSRALRC